MIFRNPVVFREYWKEFPGQRFRMTNRAALRPLYSPVCSRRHFSKDVISQLHHGVWQDGVNRKQYASHKRLDFVSIV